MVRLTDFVLRHKLLVIAFWLLAAVLGFATLDRPPAGCPRTSQLPGQPGYVADQTIAALYHNGGNQTPTVLTVTAPPDKRVDAATADRVFTAAANAVPGVRVADQANTGDAHFVTADVRTGFALVFHPAGRRLRRRHHHAAPGRRGHQGRAAGLAPPRGPGRASSRRATRLARAPARWSRRCSAPLARSAVLAFVFGSLLALLPLLMALVTIPATFLMIDEAYLPDAGEHAGGVPGRADRPRRGHRLRAAGGHPLAGGTRPRRGQPDQPCATPSARPVVRSCSPG